MIILLNHLLRQIFDFVMIYEATFRAINIALKFDHQKL